jgi:opine dehydrogenase
MYASVMSPEKLNHRFLWEDTLAGVVPMLTLAGVAGVDAPALAGLATLADSLLGSTMATDGRTATNLGMDGYDVGRIRRVVSDPDSFNAWKQDIGDRVARVSAG